MHAAFVLLAVLLTVPFSPARADASFVVDGTGPAWHAVRFTFTQTITLEVAPVGAAPRFSWTALVQGDGLLASMGYSARDQPILEVREDNQAAGHWELVNDAMGDRGSGGCMSYTYTCETCVGPRTVVALILVSASPDVAWRTTLSTDGEIRSSTNGTHMLAVQGDKFHAAATAYVGSFGTGAHATVLGLETFHAEHGVIGSFTSSSGASVLQATTPQGDRMCDCFFGSLESLAPPGDYSFSLTGPGVGWGDENLVVADVEIPA